jgi:hypothetical protein
LPTTNRHKWFKYNGETYVGAGSGKGDGYLMTIYKWDGSAWTTVLSGTGSNGLSNASIDCDDFKVVEYNGKAHFISGSKHAIFDGATFIASTRIPPSSGMPVLYQGKLYVYSTSNYTLYLWNDSTSAWDTVVTFAEHASTCFVINGELYFAEAFFDKCLWKYNDGALTQVGTFNTQLSDFIVVDNVLYCTKNITSFAKLYRYDFEIGDLIELGNIPTTSQIFLSMNTNDISFVGTTVSSSNSSYTAAYQFFKVNIVETA